VKGLVNPANVSGVIPYQGNYEHSTIVMPGGLIHVAHTVEDVRLTFARAGHETKLILDLKAEELKGDGNE
jgi:hypothetical protein